MDSAQADAIARTEFGPAKQRADSRARLIAPRKLSDAGTITFSPPANGIYAEYIEASQIGNRVSLSERMCAALTVIEGATGITLPLLGLMAEMIEDKTDDAPDYEIWIPAAPK